ncbi:right-handed parallel beta-helix repeat-containing protein [Gracilimonas mengyeensis]|uniref:Parallel beta-helix repeat (Two copies) n=1 Tax=Gracilimonas mengyeensis TaxID=1302730 RepID=A0A521ES38_9BACT|nr:right-handed parallel beta-helix repeat-containing protein [Gracilimonas mengyeensis]SMO86768.1 parallel beta-helix repeat (two copies) [Gracilimonas mengyeensis]
MNTSTLHAILLNFLLMGLLAAQPSGGPYGPIQQNYELPEVSGTIYYVAPNGNADAAGASLDSPTTIESAISKVVTGDAIVLRGGTYRTGDLELNQKIVMQPYQDEKPVFKGTYVADDWETVSPGYGDQPGLWKTDWSDLFPSRPDTWWRTERAGRQTPLHKFNNDMVFVDGRFLQSAGWLNELNEDNFYIDYENETVYISTDPTDKEVEITAFDQALIITPREVHGKQADGQGPTIRGIDFTQYAFHVIDVEGYFPEGDSDEDDHGNDVVGTTLEHCSISYGGRVGVFVLGDGFSLRHSKISDTSTEGLYVLASDDVLLEKNIFTRNNIENITGYYPAAVKIFNQSHRVVVNDNLVIDHPNSNGIWYDVGNVDGVFTNNWLEGVGHTDEAFSGRSVWPSRNAFFFEISLGVRVAGNVFVNNDHGMLILNSSDAKIYNNTFVNSMAVIARDRRGENADHFGWHIRTGPGVKERVNHAFSNNLLVADEDFERPLLQIWQLPDMCEDFGTPSLTELDHNAYVKLNDNEGPITWMAQNINGQCVSEFSNTAAVNRAISDFAENSFSFTDYEGPLFKSIDLKNFELLDGFKGASAAGDIPSYIQEVINRNDSEGYIGAYPQTN